MINKIKQIFKGSTPEVSKQEITGIEVHDSSGRVYANYQIKECEITKSPDGKVIIIKVK